MTAISETSLKLELGLAASRLDAAIEFYTTLLGTAPVRRVDDFARFEVDDPPLVLTLRAGSAQARPVQASGSLNHMGYRLEDADRLIEIQHRLESAGISTQREDGVECCYSHQTKFWVSDPEGNIWEIYSLDDEDDEHPADDSPVTSPRDDELPVAWGHRNGEPWPENLPFGDSEADEIYLHGTLDEVSNETVQRGRLAEVLRALKHGGSLGVELSIGIDELTASIATVASAGFLGVRIDQISPLDNARQSTIWRIQLSAIKPDSRGTATRFEVMYLGCARQVELADGQVFRRGERVAVDRETWNLLGTADYATAFTCFPARDA